VARRDHPLAAFLDAHPEFAFDVEEYILSTQSSSYLTRRLDRFESCLRASDSVFAYSEHIVDSFNGGACKWVPAYQQLGPIRHLSDLPLIEKQSLRERLRDFTSIWYRSDQIWAKLTTGSSGPPIQVFYSPDFYFDFLLLSLHKLAIAAGLTDIHDRPVFCLAVSGNLSSRDFVVADPTNRAGLFVQVVCDESKPETYSRAIQLIERLQPICLSSKPSMLEILCSMIPRNAYTGSYPRLLVSGGAELTPHLREALAARFSATIADSYGMTEFGVIAFEVDGREMFIDTSAFAIEVLDEHGSSLPCGQVGELVISSLANMAMPLLRYKTGDMGALHPTGTRLQTFIGRKIRCFKLPDGELFSPTYFNDLFARFPYLADFQISQLTPTQFHLVAVPRSQADVDQPAYTAVRDHVANSLPPGLTVTVSPGPFRGSGKFERFRIEF
jgi:phenylacetate-CoA ligase